MINISGRFSQYGFSAPAQAWRDSAFEKYLDIDIQRQKMQKLPPGQMLPSVYLQFMHDYEDWKARQPEVNLPDSQGWSDENLAFLRQRYGQDDLSANEIYDALTVMEDMGILSRRAREAAEGVTWVRTNLQGGVYTHPGLDADSRGAWLHGFDEAPMVGFRTLEDIFSWARDFREEDYPSCITYAEALARNWI